MMLKIIKEKLLVLRYTLAPGLAIQYFQNGDTKKAEDTLNRAINNLIPSKKPSNAFLLLRIDCLGLLADFLRKQEKDLEYQFELLFEAHLMLNAFPFIVEKLTNDNIPYKINLNLSITATKLGDDATEEKALRSAIEFAYSSPNKLTTLTFLTKNLVLQDDTTNEVNNYLKQIDELLDETSVPENILAIISTTKAIAYFKADDRINAKREIQLALNFAPHDWKIEGVAKTIAQDIGKKDKLLQKIKNALERDSKEVKDKKEYSPLPQGIITFDFQNEENAKSKSSKDIFSQEEQRRIEHELGVHKKNDQLDILEKKLPEYLSKHQTIDSFYIFLQNSYSRYLKDKTYLIDAQRLAEKSIWAAYNIGEITQLIMALDLRAEILTFAEEFPEALRTIEVAEGYIKEYGQEGVYLNTWLSHTKGMIYTGLGSWDLADENLKKAISGFSYLKEDYNKAMALGDWVNMIINRLETGGYNNELLKQAINATIELVSLFRKMGNDSYTFRAQLDKLRLLTLKGIHQKDDNILLSTYHELSNLARKYGGANFFKSPSNTVLHFLWNELLFIIDHTRIEWRTLEPMYINICFREQLKTLHLGLQNHPGNIGLLHLSVKTYLCKVKVREGEKTPNLQQATSYLAQIVSLLNKENSNAMDSQLMALYKKRLGLILETIAETIFYILKETPHLKKEAEELITLTQFFSGSRRSDFSRIPSTNQPSNDYDKELEILLQKEKTLAKWLGDFENLKLKEKACELDYMYRLILDKELLIQELNKIKIKLSNLSEVSYQPKFIENNNFEDINNIRNTLSKGEMIVKYFIGSLQRYCCLIDKDEITMLPLKYNNEIEKFQKFIRFHGFIGIKKEKSRQESTTLSIQDFKQKIKNASSFEETMKQLSHWLFPKEFQKKIKDRNINKVFIIGEGLLWNIPFSILEMNGQLAIQQLEISITPSIYLVGSSEEKIDAKNVYAVGHPGLPYLENVEQEINLLRENFNASTLFHKDAKTKIVIEKVLPKATVLHIASHAISDSIAPMLSYFLLEPDENNESGKLFLIDILKQNTNAKLVSVFSCYSANVDNVNTFSESLALSFMSVGAKYVIASNWEANDQDCFDFANDLYKDINNNIRISKAYQNALKKAIEKYLSKEKKENYPYFNSEQFARLGCFSLLSSK